MTLNGCLPTTAEVIKLCSIDRYVRAAFMCISIFFVSLFLLVLFSCSHCTLHGSIDSVVRIVRAFIHTKYPGRNGLRQCNCVRILLSLLFFFLLAFFEKPTLFLSFGLIFLCYSAAAFGFAWLGIMYDFAIVVLHTLCSRSRCYICLLALPSVANAHICAEHSPFN